MPEGPEIRLAADRVASALVGRQAIQVGFAFDRLKEFESLFVGYRVIDVKTRGKAMLTCFENDWIIYSHNQLYGRWYICQRGELPVTGRQLRIEIHNPQYSALLYSASEIEVMHQEDVDQHPFLKRLGPDILSDKPDAEEIVSRFNLRKFRNRQFAGLLLDQQFLAGLGNYLRAEILTVSRLHPLTRPADCSARELLKLAKNIIRLTHRSYRTGGIINPPGLVSKLRSKGITRREEYRFNTYNREGQACYLCGHKIESSNAGGRKMYFCPCCQKISTNAKE